MSDDEHIEHTDQTDGPLLEEEAKSDYQEMLISELRREIFELRQRELEYKKMSGVLRDMEKQLKSFEDN